MIYVASILDGKFVKVGFCKDDDPSVRIAQLQTGNPFKINLVFCVPGTLIQEQAIHSSLRVAFSRIRVPMPPNEWYPGHHFMREFMKELVLGANVGLAFSEAYNPSVRQFGAKECGQEPNIRWPSIKGVG